MKKQNKAVCSTLAQVKKMFPQGIEKLEIGSGNNPEPGYIHLDIQADLPDLEILSNVRTMPLPDNFVSEDVRAVHIMEHFCHPKHAGKELIDRYGSTTEILAEVYRILKPGGKFRIVTPDIEKISQSLATRRIKPDWAQRWCVGGHLDEYDVHHWLWTKQDAQKWFAEAGFKQLTDWNPVRTRKEVWGLKWGTPDVPGNMAWHKIEWYHWLFFEGTK